MQFFKYNCGGWVIPEWANIPVDKAKCPMEGNIISD